MEVGRRGMKVGRDGVLEEVAASRQSSQFQGDAVPVVILLRKMSAPRSTEPQR